MGTNLWILEILKDRLIIVKGGEKSTEKDMTKEESTSIIMLVSILRKNAVDNGDTRKRQRNIYR